MRSGFVNSLLLRVVPKLLSWIMRLWFGTCRVTVHNGGVMSSIDRGETNIVASFWHYSIIFIFYFVRNYSATAMVSSSRDGEYIARLAGELGFNTVRGSKNNKGVEALKGMLRAVRAGDNGAIVADGSQGPARVAQAGALLVAAKTGKPVVPMVWAASSYFTIKSWDKTAIPKPFSRIDLYFGESMYLPRKVSADELEQYRGLLENNLNELYSKAWSLYGKTSHE
ncbi:MAG: lysophospholipid acyltransferase (LPLAT)-like uncharacterized protein [Desulforhopalus sp.]|jgi:lysophospholipid acyltransferase (LPLAT)-like uncharacterized protein